MKNITLLQLAATRSRYKCVVELVANGADVDFERDYTNTALSLVSLHYRVNWDDHKTIENYKIIKFLVESNANCNGVYNTFRFSPFSSICDSIIKERHHEYTMELLNMFLDHSITPEQLTAAQDHLRSNGKPEWADYIRDYQPMPVIKGYYGPL